VPTTHPLDKEERYGKSVRQTRAKFGKQQVFGVERAKEIDMWMRQPRE
jgi:hypothetical protein